MDENTGGWPSEGSLWGLQDDVLIGMSSNPPRFSETLCRRLPPWRAVMLARIANSAGLLSDESLANMVNEAREVGGNGRLRLEVPA